jgi:hypothetical protein
MFVGIQHRAETRRLAYQPGQSKVAALPDGDAGGGALVLLS